MLGTRTGLITSYSDSIFDCACQQGRVPVIDERIRLESADGAVVVDDALAPGARLDYAHENVFVDLGVHAYECKRMSGSVVAFVGAKEREARARASFIIHRATVFSQTANAGSLQAIAKSVGSGHGLSVWILF